MEGDNGEEVDDDDDGAGDSDGPGQVPHWVLRRREVTVVGWLVGLSLTFISSMMKLR